MVPGDAAPFCSDGNAISYVPPVSWMTSRFHIMEQMGQNKRRHGGGIIIIIIIYTFV